MALPNAWCDSMYVQVGMARVVRSVKRKRKLNRRGDHCRWSIQLKAWIWFPKTRLNALNSWKGSNIFSRLPDVRICDDHIDSERYKELYEGKWNPVMDPRPRHK